jgi:hypothetical protein
LRGQFGFVWYLPGGITLETICAHNPAAASAGRIHATDYFGDLRQAELFVAGMFSLRREGEIKIGEAKKLMIAERRDRDTGARVLKNDANTDLGV